VYEQAGAACARFEPSVPSRLFAVQEIDVARFPSAVLKQD
jgi:hypothetical protein